MKISVFPALLSLVLTAALTYLAYYIGQEDENNVLGVAMSVRFANERVGLSIKVCSILCFVVMLITNLCFAWIGVNAPLYVILQTVLLVTYLFVIWKLSEVKNV